MRRINIGSERFDVFHTFTKIVILALNAVWMTYLISIDTVG
jgi:hypothetical protein